MLEIDGSYAEGGGQILRTALALSMATQQPFKITRIRVNREFPGLKTQHAMAIKFFEQNCSAEVSPYGPGTEHLVFKPGTFKPGHYSVDIGTAGSITLLLQAILLPILFAKDASHITLTGGTNVPWSMPIDYFARTFIPAMEVVASMDCVIQRRGFYPKGGGVILLNVRPTGNREPLVRERQGVAVAVDGIAYATFPLQRGRVSERMAESASDLLGLSGYTVNIRAEYADSLSDGAGIVLVSHHTGEKTVLGADALGQRGLPAEMLAEDAVRKLTYEISSGAAVDSHLADNLIPYLGLLGGRIKTSSITKHVISNIYVTETFLGVKFHVDADRGIIEVPKGFTHET